MNGSSPAAADGLNGTVKGAKGRKKKSKASRNGRVKVEHPSVLSDREKAIAGQILKEIEARLDFLLNVGLDYLTLSRTASTLSGGEAQRIRLATQIGSGLMGVLYVCDEPSIGLHPADDYRLIQTLKGLRDLGNTVLIVEHDEAIMRAADYIVDLGPGAGEHGGHIVATGPVEDIMAAPESITGQYLSGRRQIPLPEERRPGNGERLVIRGAAQNNLKDIDVEIPLGMLVCVTGVSGSGKSTLINEILYKKLAQQFYRARDRAGAVRDIEGWSISTRWWTSTSRLSVGRRGAIRRHTRIPSRRYASCSRRCRRLGCGGISRGGSRSMLRAGAARLARGTGISISRCSFCRMLRCRARYARGSGITARRWRFTGGTRISRMCWR